jgi:hypothetical protein
VARHPALQPKVLTVAHDGDQRALHDDDAPAIDAHLHADLLSNSGIRRTYPAQLADLPEGAMVELDGRPWLVTQGQLLAWNPGGVISSSSFLTNVCVLDDRLLRPLRQRRGTYAPSVVTSEGVR